MFVDRVREWCARQDLNLHGFPHYHLKVARLPISPYAHKAVDNEAAKSRESKGKPRRTKPGAAHEQAKGAGHGLA